MFSLFFSYCYCSNERTIENKACVSVGIHGNIASYTPIMSLLQNIHELNFTLYKIQHSLQLLAIYKKYDLHIKVNISIKASCNHCKLIE